MSCRNNNTKKVEKLRTRLAASLKNGKVKVKGKFIAGAISVEVQNSLSRIEKGLYDGIQPEGTTLGEAIIIETVQAASVAEDPNLMQEMLSQINTLKAEGKLEVDNLLKERQAEIDTLEEAMAADTSRLTFWQQKVKNTINNMLAPDGEVDLTVLQLLAKDANIKFNPENFRDDPKKGAKALRKEIDRRQKSWSSRIIGKAVGAKLGALSTWGYKDLDGVLQTISRGGTVEGSGVLSTVIDEKLREANEKTYEVRDRFTVMLGQMIEKAYGIAPKKFSGKQHQIDQTNHYEQLIQEQSMRSAAVDDKIEIEGITDINGDAVILEKGELIQLYMDSLDADVMHSMNNAGISEEYLLQLVADNLSDQDRQFAMTMVDEFFPAVYEMENEVYKKIYFTSMPKTANYGGQIRYQDSLGEVQEIDFGVSTQQQNNRQKANIVLNNAVVRSRDNNKKLDLKRNVFSNTVNRMQNSYKFIGGAEVYNTVAQAWNGQKVKASVRANNSYDYHTVVKNKIDENFGFYEPKVGKVPSWINWLRGNFIFTALAAKVKLAVTQVTSAALWLGDSNTWSGMLNKRHKDLVGENIVQLLYDNSATLRNRYRTRNLIALENNIDSAAYQSEMEYMAKSGVGKFREKYRAAGMWFTMKGDYGGIMAGGAAYFKSEYAKGRAAGLTHEQAIKSGVAKFNKKWQKSQQSYEAIDRADVQKGIWGLFTMFLTSPFQLGRHTFDSIRQLSRMLVGKQAKGGWQYQTARLALFHFYSSASYNAITMLLPGILFGDDEEKKDKLLQQYLVNVVKGPWMNSLFVLGDIAAAVEGKIMGAHFDSPIAKSTAFAGVEKALHYIGGAIELGMKEDLTEAQETRLEVLQWNASMEVLQILLAFPTKTAGLMKNKQGIVEIQEGMDKILNGEADEETMARLLGWSQYVMDAAKENKVRGKGKGGDPLNLNNSLDLGGGLDLNGIEIDFDLNNLKID